MSLERADPPSPAPASAAGRAYEESNAYEDPRVEIAQQWLNGDKQYSAAWAPQLLAGVLVTLPREGQLKQEDVRTRDLWPAGGLNIPPPML